MQTAIQALAPPHYTPTLSHRQYNPHNHRPVSSINSTPRSTHLLAPAAASSSTATASASGYSHSNSHTFTHYSQQQPPPLPLPTPTPVARKRKRPAQQVSVSYSEVREVDDAGCVREVIVIEDTPPPGAQPPLTPQLGAGMLPSSGLHHTQHHHTHHPGHYYPPPPLSGQSASTLTVSPAFSTSTARTSVRNGFSLSMQPPLYGAPVRTRARAAAEAQQMLFMSTGSSSGSSVSGPQVKKRKRDNMGDVDGLAAKKVLTGASSKYAQSLTQSHWQNGALPAVEEVRFHRL